MEQIATQHGWPDSLVKTLRVEVDCIAIDSANSVIKELINENTYPFAEIGVLTLTRDDDPKLSDYY